MRPGEMPFSSAAIRVNGLKAEPGWRRPCVARLNGPLLEVGAADHRADAARVVVDRHERGARADAAQARRDRLLGRLLQLEVERGADLQAAGEGVTAPVPVHQLVLDPGGEVRREADLLRRLDPVARRQRLLLGLHPLARGDQRLLVHALQHQVAPLDRDAGVLDRAVGGGRGDHPGQQRRLGGLQDVRAAAARTRGGSSRSRRAPPTRSRMRPRRSRRCSGTR